MAFLFEADDPEAAVRALAGDHDLQLEISQVVIGLAETGEVVPRAMRNQTIAAAKPRSAISPPAGTSTIQRCQRPGHAGIGSRPDSTFGEIT